MILRDTPDIETCWVIVDVNEISVKNLTVLGVLHFQDNSATVRATYIAVLVSLYVFLICLFTYVGSVSVSVKSFNLRRSGFNSHLGYFVAS